MAAHPQDAETRYRLLGRLLEEMPAAPTSSALSKDLMLWLGRADALVASFGDAAETLGFRMNVDRIQSFPAYSFRQLQLTLYRLLAAAELAAPPGARGVFIPAGNSFDAFAGLTKVMGSANSDLFVVDAYLDSRILTDFAGAIPMGVPLRLLADEKKHGATLGPASQRWAQQHGAKQPLEVRLAPARSLHDRAIFVDSQTAWIVSQSFKDFAARSPASIINGADIADQKIPAYEDIWTLSRPI